ncbi:hypothetical protein V6N13_097880 [Hibiscus sabdariffa]
MEGGSVSRLVLGFRMVDREVVDWGRESRERKILHSSSALKKKKNPQLLLQYPSKFCIWVNLLESLNDVQIAGADSNTEIGGCKSEPSPAERQRKRKRYERSKGYMEKIKKTCEKIAEIEGALLEERDEAQQKRDVKIAFKLNHLKEAQKKRDGKIAFKLKCLKKALERLRAGTTRSEEKRGLMLSVHRQQLNPQSFTLQIATVSF